MFDYQKKTTIAKWQLEIGRLKKTIKKLAQNIPHEMAYVLLNETNQYILTIILYYITLFYEKMLIFQKKSLLWSHG